MSKNEKQKIYIPASNPLIMFLASELSFDINLKANSINPKSNVTLMYSNTESFVDEIYIFCIATARTIAVAKYDTKICTIILFIFLLFNVNPRNKQLIKI